MLSQLIATALAEDLGQEGDITAQYFIPAEARARARVVAREPGVAAGLEAAREVFHQIDPQVVFRVLVEEGGLFAKGQALLEVRGSARSLVTAERTALNFLQRLCAIATPTRRYVEAVKPFSTKILDTRKTTPGLRALEKAAVKAGGGTNHRFGLYDQVMVKDNHLVAEGNLPILQAAIDRLKADFPEVKVEVEADTLEQVRGFLTLRGIDIILLDNMLPPAMRQAVEMAAGRVILEASGGITLETIAEVAATGVDAISVGALTHTVRALDLSLEFEAN